MLLAGAAAARAQESGGSAEDGHRICNRTGYILEAALAIETQGASATQGWFRLLPGRCGALMEGAAAGERYFLHVRTPDFYGETSEFGEVSRMFCVRGEDFLLAGAGRCNGKDGTLAGFSEVGGDGRGASELTEARDMNAATARIAAIQRLLALSGFAPGEEEGKAGKGTRAALDAFAKSRGEPRLAGAAVLGDEGESGDEALFAALYEAARKAVRGAGLTLCNATAGAMTAAVARQDAKGITTRGWYPIAPGSCRKVIVEALGEGPLWLRAEAVDGQGNTLVSDGRPLIWGGGKELCVQASKFEIAEQGECAARGLKAAGFFPVDTANESGVTVRLSPKNRQGDENSR